MQVCMMSVGLDGLGGVCRLWGEGVCLVGRVLFCVRCKKSSDRM